MQAQVLTLADRVAALTAERPGSSAGARSAGSPASARTAGSPGAYGLGDLGPGCAGSPASACRGGSCDGRRSTHALAQPHGQAGTGLTAAGGIGIWSPEARARDCGQGSAPARALQAAQGGMWRCSPEAGAARSCPSAPGPPFAPPCAGGGAAPLGRSAAAARRILDHLGIGPGAAFGMAPAHAAAVVCAVHRPAAAERRQPDHSAPEPERPSAARSPPAWAAAASGARPDPLSVVHLFAEQVVAARALTACARDAPGAAAGGAAAAAAAEATEAAPAAPAGQRGCGSGGPGGGPGARGPAPETHASAAAAPQALTPAPAPGGAAGAPPEPRAAGWAPEPGAAPLARGAADADPARAAGPIPRLLAWLDEGEPGRACATGRAPAAGERPPVRAEEQGVAHQARAAGRASGDDDRAAPAERAPRQAGQAGQARAAAQDLEGVAAELPDEAREAGPPARRPPCNAAGTHGDAAAGAAQEGDLLPRPPAAGPAAGASAPAQRAPAEAPADAGAARATAAVPAARARVAAGTGPATAAGAGSAPGSTPDPGSTLVERPAGSPACAGAHAGVWESREGGVGLRASADAAEPDAKGAGPGALAWQAPPAGADVAARMGIDSGADTGIVCALDCAATVERGPCSLALSPPPRAAVAAPQRSPGAQPPAAASPPPSPRLAADTTAPPHAGLPLRREHAELRGLCQLPAVAPAACTAAPGGRTSPPAEGPAAAAGADAAVRVAVCAPAPDTPLRGSGKGAAAPAGAGVNAPAGAAPQPPAAEPDGAGEQGAAAAGAAGPGASPCSPCPGEQGGTKTRAAERAAGPALSAGAVGAAPAADGAEAGGRRDAGGALCDNMQAASAPGEERAASCAAVSSPSGKATALRAPPPSAWAEDAGSFAGRPCGHAAAPCSGDPSSPRSAEDAPSVTRGPADPCPGALAALQAGLRPLRIPRSRAGPAPVPDAGPAAPPGQHPAAGAAAAAARGANASQSSVRPPAEVERASAGAAALLTPPPPEPRRSPEPRAPAAAAVADAILAGLLAEATAAVVDAAVQALAGAAGAVARAEPGPRRPPGWPTGPDGWGAAAAAAPAAARGRPARRWAGGGALGAEADSGLKAAHAPEAPAGARACAAAARCALAPTAPSSPPRAAGGPAGDSAAARREAPSAEGAGPGGAHPPAAELRDLLSTESGAWLHDREDAPPERRQGAGAALPRSGRALRRHAAPAACAPADGPPDEHCGCRARPAGSVPYMVLGLAGACLCERVGWLLRKRRLVRPLHAGVLPPPRQSRC